MRLNMLPIVAVLVLPAAIAQTTAPSVSKARPLAAPMLPFYAEFRSTRVQVLANGATITTETAIGIARDSQGREYNFTTQPSRGGQPEFTSFHIHDPVAATETQGDSQRKTATVYQLPAQDQQHGCWRSESGDTTWTFPPTPEQRAAEKAGQNSQPIVSRDNTRQVKQEDLGTDTFQGLLVRGYRTTRTIPAGEFGNDQTLVSTFESWSSVEYGFEVRHIQDDPQQGKATFELTGFQPGEPDPSLFQPPQGYEIVAQQLYRLPCHH